MRWLISGKNSGSSPGLLAQIPSAASQGQPWVAYKEMAMGLVRGTGGKPDPQATPPCLLGHQEKALIQSESLGG